MSDLYLITGLPSTGKKALLSGIRNVIGTSPYYFFLSTDTTKEVQLCDPAYETAITAEEYTRRVQAREYILEYSIKNVQYGIRWSSLNELRKRGRKAMLLLPFHLIQTAERKINEHFHTHVSRACTLCVLARLLFSVLLWRARMLVNIMLTAAVPRVFALLLALYLLPLSTDRPCHLHRRPSAATHQEHSTVTRVHHHTR